MMDYIIYILFILVIIYFLIRFINILRYEIKYKNVNTNTSGCEIAQKLLDKYEVNNTYVIETKNPFEQGYCYGRNVLKLLPSNFNGESITSIIISCYEAMKIVGEKKSLLFKIRNRLQYTIDILSILTILGIIISLILKDFYILKLCISSFFIITILNSIFSSLIANNIEMVNNFIKEESIYENKTILEEILNTYKYYYSVQSFRAILKIILFIKAK